MASCPITRAEGLRRQWLTPSWITVTWLSEPGIAELGVDEECAAAERNDDAAVTNHTKSRTGYPHSAPKISLAATTVLQWMVMVSSRRTA